MPTDDVRARREKVVLDHFHDEVEQDWDAVLSTFPHPRYEIVPTQIPRGSPVTSPRMTRHLARRIFKVLAAIAISMAALITLYAIVALILVALGVWGGA